MDFTNTSYVRIYVPPSPTGRLWGFFGRMLMDELIKRSDRAGVIELAPELAEDLAAAVAVAIDCPDVDFVREHLPKLTSHGAAVQKGHYLVLPRYHEGQYATAHRNQRTKDSRAKLADTERAIALGLIKSPRWYLDRQATKPKPEPNTNTEDEDEDGTKAQSA